jgi:hypothetical protein
MRIHVSTGEARRDYLHQWHKARYKTDKSEARTLSVAELQAYASERGLEVAASVTQRRVKHA